jgi:site-specific DNA-methyltransferase (adenine-specific)
MEINRIYQTDCLEGLKQLEDNSIDLVIADPPYNINKDDWDSFNNLEYINWMNKWIIEVSRVLKDNGSFYFFHNQLNTIIDLIYWLRYETDFIVKQMITWVKIDKNFKNRGFVHQRLSIEMMRNYYDGFTEYVIYCTFQDETGLETIMENNIKPLHPFAKYLKDEFKKSGVTRKEIAELFPSKTGGLTGCVSNWLNGDNVITKEQYHKIKDYLGGDYLRREYEDLRREYEDLRYTFNVTNTQMDLRANSNVWFYPPAPKKGHITPKPEELIKNIILHSSNPNDIILDPFMGSGTTAKVAKELNRNYIGFELEEKYVDIANERLKSIQKILV